MKIVWKRIATISIIINIIVILGFLWLWGIGIDVVESENICGLNICKDYESFYYDVYENICYCYIAGEVAHSEVVIK